MAQVLRLGDVLDGRFRLDAKLGQGAFGAVYRGTDLEDGDRPVAVKVLLDKYKEDRKMRQRFLQEAKLLEHLEHPSIATAYLWRADDDLAYLVMELIEGQSLDQRCEHHSADQRHIPKQGIAWICDQLCAAVDFAHRQGVIHRDLKPRNVMVNRAGARPFVKVLDFGIAKVLVGSEVDPTTVGRVLGSVLYIAPEQILSRTLDHRADVFSLGTILFEMLTLRRAWARTLEGEPHPFHVAVPVGDVNNHVMILRRIAREPRPSACAVRPDLAPAVDEVLHRALAIDAEERFDSAAELAAAMRQALIEEHLEPSASAVEVRSAAESPALALDALPDEDEQTTQKPTPIPPAATTAPGALVGAGERGDPTAPLEAVGAGQPAQPAPALEPTNTMADVLEPAIPPAATEVEPAPPVAERSATPWFVLAVLVATVAIGAALVLLFGLRP